MTRIGPYGDGSCSTYSPGSRSLNWKAIATTIDGYVDPVQPSFCKRLIHGGSANLALRDWRLAVLSDGHLKLLDAESLGEVQQFPTCVRRGWPGWDYTWARKEKNNKCPVAGHSVPAGLCTVNWLENGLVHIRAGGDVATSQGIDFVRVSGDAARPDLKPMNNQRENVGACDGNDMILNCIGGHGFGRSSTGSFSGVVNAPGLMNNPCYMSTPEAHYIVAPFPVLMAGKTGFINWSGGIQINRVQLVGDKRCVFPIYKTNARCIPNSGDGSYAPQPWCLSGRKIYIVQSPMGALRNTVLAAIDVGDGTSTETTIPFLGMFPRIAANPDGCVVLVGNNSIMRVGGWSRPVSLTPEFPQSNQQFCNHVAITDRSVFVARMNAASLVVSEFNLQDGSQIGEIKLQIDGADDTSLLCDFFHAQGSLYCLLNPCEPKHGTTRKFNQVIVRVS